jgi:DNA repair photolyase
MFGYRSAMPVRWPLADSEEEGTLFPDERKATRHVGQGAYAGLEFLYVNARTIINTVPAESLMPFRHTTNCYWGCSHACSFARPTHDYLGLGIGEDFEKRIVVKINAVERLRAELRASKWAGEPIAMGTNTDPYQHAEGKYHLTRGVIDVLSAARNPFSILTKSTSILRDAAALAAAAGRTDVAVNFSVGVLVAPVLPGLSDSDNQLRSVVEAAAAAGAVSITGVALHLRGSVREHYFGWLDQVRPDLSSLYRERFRRGAYQEAAERDRIGELVRAVALRSGVTGPAPDARTTPEEIQAGAQLSLLSRRDR